MFAILFNILGTLVPAILQNSGVIGASTTNLISNLLGPVGNLISGLQKGAGATTDVLAGLAAIQGVTEALRGVSGLPADVLTILDGVEKDVSAALTGYAKAANGFDASIYAPIATV
jgi:hypothetical protein